RTRGHTQAPAHLLRGAVALGVIAPQAAGDEVLPTVTPSARTRQDVVDRRGVLAAVPATVLIATQHAPPGDRHSPTAWHPHVAAEDDDGGSIEAAVGCVDGIVLDPFDHARLLVEHEHESSFERDHREGLVSGVQ